MSATALILLSILMAFAGVLAVVIATATTSTACRR